MAGKRTAQLVAGARTLGLGLTLQALLYPVRRRYYEARFSAPGRPSALRGLAGILAGVQPTPAGLPPREELTLLGSLTDYSADAQMVRVHCERGWLQVAVLAADLLRVRLSPAGAFPPPQSYAVAKTDLDWPAVACTVHEDTEAVEIRTERLTCRIARRPCRLTFLDAQGRSIHADSAGVGWKGPQVARIAALHPDEHVYGLGEKAFPLDRRGRRYSMWNIDPQGYAPGAEPLYLSIPFYVSARPDRAYGVFYDNSYRSTFDVGAARPDEVAYCAEDGELRFYFFSGTSLAAVLERYTELTGRMRLPPLWALGYQQSRWSYYPEARVREIAQMFREQSIPCDALHLDIHYMRGYRCFTWDPQRFPDPPAMIGDLHSAGFKVVSMIDCGIKADRVYPVCSEGLAQGLFCTYPDGKPAGGPVWPGECYFPDFTSPRVREWWGGLYGPLLEAGVDGIWNDMNEPTVIGPQGGTLAGCVRHEWEGEGSDHRKAHNVYGMEMARATAEGLRRLRPAERPFVFTRAGWAGVQRYATSWTADNQSTWDHLRLTTSMVMGLGLSGLAFSGPDIGGFQGGANGELLVRWMQLGAFLPFFRGHAALYSPNQEPWAFGEPYTSMNRAAIELRYRLLPYLYTAVWQCAQTGMPIVRPLVMAWPDDSRACALDDQFLCGDALLVAPVWQPGATSREVYLPAGFWYDFWTSEQQDGPKAVTVAAPLDRIPVFVRAGAVLPMWPVMQHVGQRPLDRLFLHAYFGEGKSWLYEDDGHSVAYTHGDYRVTSLECRTLASGLSIVCERQGPYRPEYSSLEWHVHGLGRPPGRAIADNQPVQSLAWDEHSRTLHFETGEAYGIQLA